VEIPCFFEAGYFIWLKLESFEVISKRRYNIDLKCEEAKSELKLVFQQVFPSLDGRGWPALRMWRAWGRVITPTQIPPPSRGRGLTEKRI
jgi:hypothetical protein